MPLSPFCFHAAFPAFSLAANMSAEIAALRHADTPAAASYEMPRQSHFYFR